MIRRAANLNAIGAAGTATVATAGWVLGWYVQGNTTTGQTMYVSFEEGQHGVVTAQPLSQIQFQDGLPAVIPTF